MVSCVSNIFPSTIGIFTPGGSANPTAYQSSKLRFRFTTLITTLLSTFATVSSPLNSFSSSPPKTTNNWNPTTAIVNRTPIRRSACPHPVLLDVPTPTNEPITPKMKVNTATTNTIIVAIEILKPPVVFTPNMVRTASPPIKLKNSRIVGSA